MKDIQQLIKKNSQEGRYEGIFPKTFIDAVEDRESGNSLTEILSGFNMYFLSYNGSREQTRLQVPMSIRKTGLWITYVLYDKTVVTEWYAGEAIDDNSWKNLSNWRVGTNMLVGDISISSDGYWIINGVITNTKAQGEQGITPRLRVGNNHLQVSYTNGSSWIDVSEFTNSLHIKGYATTVATLPSSAVQGDIYGVGPTYDPSDTGHTNPIYQLYVKDSTGWVNNGKFTSIAAGVVQTTGTSTTEVMSQDAVSKELAQVETDLNYMYPSVGTAKRILLDAGTIKSRSTLNELTNKFLDLLPNTKLLFCPHLAVKLRESGIYKYVTKLYDIGPSMLDGTQTTALNQPFLSGNIAPNEKYAIKNPNGGNAYLTHTPISFSATDKWSVSTMLNDFCSSLTDYGAYCGNGTTASNIYLRKSSANRLRFLSNSSVEYLFNVNNSLIGKNSLITFVSFGNGTLNLYLNGKLFQTISSTDTSFIFSRILNSYSTLGLNGDVKYHGIRDIALTPSQIQDEHSYLRTLFPEIESVQIGTQTWTTSNCEMTCTPQGNVIPEMQAATNVEKISGGDFENGIIGSKNEGGGLATWVLNDENPINGLKDGRLIVINPTTNDTRRPLLSFNSGRIVGSWRRFSFKYKLNSGICKLTSFHSGGTVVDVNRDLTGEGVFISPYYKVDGSVPLTIYFNGTKNFDIQIDDVSELEVGWDDSTNLYNDVYANTTGTAEQKEYAAVKAAAMWRNVNNDTVLASVYGKKFNKYAKRLLAMDIAYYNAANPTALWGWDIPTRAQLTTLAANGGNALKVAGSNYWNTANGNNATGFSLLGGGYIDTNGVYVNNKAAEGVWCKDADFASIALDGDNTFNEVAATTEGYSIRLIKV